MGEIFTFCCIPPMEDNEMYYGFNHETRSIYQFRSCMEWSSWFEHSEDRIIKQEIVGCWFVSTVFLSLDHGWGLGHKPVLFETMVFAHGNDGGDIIELTCSCTYDEALHDHAAMVERYRHVPNPRPVIS